MGLYACWGVLCALAWIAPCLSQGDDVFSVVVDVQGDSVLLQMGGQLDLDICKTFICPQGTKCEVQMAPALLKIPMPRCVPDKHAPQIVDGCKEITVATNILQCRSEEEWSRVGRTQCQLNPVQGQSTRLINSKASHVCPPLSLPPMVRYLSASFNCCVAGMAVETTSLPEIATPSKEEEAVEVEDPMAVVKTEPEPEVQEVIETTTAEQSKGLQYIKDRISDLGEEAIKLTGIDSTAESTEQTSSVFYLLLLILGLSFLLSFLLISLLISLRLKQRRKRQRQQKNVVTSVVNPGAADTDMDHIVQFSNDKASLVDHMQLTQ